jgi:hypothetical protein
VAFLGPIADDTRAAFAPCEVLQWPLVTADRVASVRPDVILLHNTSPRRVRRAWSTPTIQYAHSYTELAAADLTIYCSRWLARRFGAGDADVCWQGVPRPSQLKRPRDGCRWASSVVVGRLCTPDRRKWPADVVAFYRELSRRCPWVWWEFVGCPADLQPPLREVCNFRAVFWDAGWERRDRYATWNALLYHHPGLTESFGRIVAEAMRAGCVPIVDRRGGFCEQLEPGGGLLCETLDEFAAALEEVRSFEARRRLSEQARRIADVRWSLRAFGERLRAHFLASRERERPVCAIEE